VGYCVGWSVEKKFASALLINIREQPLGLTSSQSQNKSSVEEATTKLKKAAEVGYKAKAEKSSS
jgi:hypothetical protein